jgi:hypothetical protein
LVDSGFHRNVARFFEPFGVNGHDRTVGLEIAAHDARAGNENLVFDAGGHLVRRLRLRGPHAAQHCRNGRRERADA